MQTTRKVRRKKKIYPDSRNLIKKVILILIFFGSQFIFFYSGFFNLKTVQINGNTVLSRDQILKAVNIPWNKNLFLIKQEELESKLKEVKWIKDADIRISYPDELVVNVLERKPAFFVAFGGEEKGWQQVSREGIILDKTPNPGKIRIVDFEENGRALLYPRDKMNMAQEWYNAFSPEVQSQFIFFVYDSNGELSMKFLFQDKAVEAYFGSPENVEYKANIFNSILNVLAANKTIPKSIDLRYKEPVVKLE